MASDTIVAISTPPGRSGIGIVRVSGPAVPVILERVAGVVPPPRHAEFRPFVDAGGETLDEGIVLYFPAPYSFTGEDVAEFHAHGSRVVLALLLDAIRACGARSARPGEFSERAFLNDKLDLAQAEAIADLIDSASARAARSAVRTLRGEFSRRVDEMIERIRGAHARLEASIDFPEDVASDDFVAIQIEDLDATRSALSQMVASSRQGVMLNAGVAVAITGSPNVGKSTLINALAGEDRAIVSELPGTTRDVIEADMLLTGVPVRLYDTAGLRETDNPVELEGIRRAERATREADIVLFMTDVSSATSVTAEALSVFGQDRPVLVVHNKIDIAGGVPGFCDCGGRTHVWLSALTGSGIDALKEALGRCLGIEETGENEFIARERHLAALADALAELEPVGQAMLLREPEVAAECYRRASLALTAISGAYTSEDLLGEIFSRFCIGK